MEKEKKKMRIATLDDVVLPCLNKGIAETQKKEEQGREHQIQTQGFDQIGCYSCQGYDTQCVAYYPIEPTPNLPNYIVLKK